MLPPEVTSKAPHLSLRVQLHVIIHNRKQHLLRKRPFLLKRTIVIKAHGSMKDHLFLMNVPVIEKHSTILAT